MTRAAPQPTPWRVQRVVAIASVLLFIAKLAAYGLTQSVAILTDALESTVNVVTGFISLYSLRLAAKPRDLDHPYGHGKAELVSASFEGLLIVVAGLIIVYESCINLLHPHTLQDLDLGIVLIAATALANYILGAWSIRAGRQQQSIALESSGRHLQSDTWTTIGIVAGLILVRLTNIAWIDSATALVFAGVILVEGYRILRKTISGIMDEADMGLLQQVIERVDTERRHTWIDLHNVRILKYGAILHLDCHLSVPWYFSVRQAHDEMEALHALVSSHFPHNVELFVHLDPCDSPDACKLCSVDCPVRQAVFVRRLPWTLENLSENKHHLL
ncbi:MAG: cation diffusion facilitator family transporter [Saprospiraceae bacterium]|nr:cation diffusion facilitator family transporter [Saprospiraceae bacterium]